MSKQAVPCERGKELPMRKSRILEIMCLIFCLLMLSSFACAKTPAVVIPTTRTWEERLAVYLDLISKQGYTVAKKEHTVSDSGSEFYAEIECNDATDKQAVPLAGGLSIAELYDGNLSAFLDMIQSECGRFGKVTNHITYVPFSCIGSNEWCDPVGTGYTGLER